MTERHLDATPERIPVNETAEKQKNTKGYGLLCNI